MNFFLPRIHSTSTIIKLLSSLMAFLLLWNADVLAQKKSKPASAAAVVADDKFNREPRGENELRIIFYNVENLFDTIDDPIKNDNDYLPQGNYRWGSYRYSQKLKALYKVIAATGGWEPPDIIGVCEIENRLVLEDLIKKTPLRNFNYNIIHQESPDMRGIDVGLLYREDKFRRLEEEFLLVAFDDDPSFKTRDIIYAKGIVFESDTLHLFVNHWPSRWGGEALSAPKRIRAAEVVRAKVDAILSENSSANIIVMGDFNDYPDNRSVLEILRAKGKANEIQQDDLFNLMYEKYLRNEGTHKYQGHWGCLDQFIINPVMLQSDAPVQIKNNKAFIFREDFMLQEDARHMGDKPFRTFVGFKYTGGYSDHLPIIVDIIKKQ